MRGSWGAAPADGLEPQDGDHVVEKMRMNGFFQTRLDVLLRGLGADTLLITGAWTNMSIEHTARHGADAGYEVVVASDGTSTTGDEWQHAALNYAMTNVAQGGHLRRDQERARGMIVEERTYHIHTGRLPEVVELYASEGTAIQQEHLGHLIGAFTVDVGDVSSIVQLWGYDCYAERERRRALLQADQRWKDFLKRLQPLIHTQRNRILLPDLVLADPMSALDGKVAIVTGGAQGIGRAIADELAGQGARIVIADLKGAEAAAEGVRRRRRADRRRRRPRTTSRGWRPRPSSAAARSTSWSTTPGSTRRCRCARSSRSRSTSGAG